MALPSQFKHYILQFLLEDQLFLKSSAREFIQYRLPPQSFGPSSKTCPRWAPQLEHKTSVRVIPSDRSVSCLIAPFLAKSQKLGQPVPLSNLVSDEKSSCPQTTHMYIPVSWLFVYFPENGGSVPFKKQILYCSVESLFLALLIKTLLFFIIWKTLEHKTTAKQDKHQTQLAQLK